MTDRVDREFLDDDERRARADAKASAGREAVEAAWKTIAEQSKCMVRLRPDGTVLARVGVGERAKDLVFTRGDLPVLRAILALLGDR